MKLVQFHQRLGKVTALQRELVAGIEVPDPRIIAVNIVLTTGARIWVDMSYEEAVSTLEKFDKEKEG